MMLPKVPYYTIEGDPKNGLRKLKTGVADFENMGFAAALNEDPVSYAKIFKRGFPLLDR